MSPSSSATERFADVLARPESEIPLDEAALLVAAHAHPDLDAAEPLAGWIVRWTAELDDLARDLSPGDPDALAHRLFAELGFVGNAADYADPANSYLDAVITRRLGIPITLSVLMIEVGRRAGVALVGVGMPGHFLARTASAHAGSDTTPFFDPFDGGRRLGLDGCRARFAALHGDDARFTPDYLEPVGTRAIVRRMLANLERSLLAREPSSVAWVARLQLLVPGTPSRERRRLAARLGSLGAFAEAATALDALAGEVPADEVPPLTRAARALRARAN